MGRPPKNGVARQTREEIRARDRLRNKTPERTRWMKERDLRKLFGITLADYEGMIAAQKNLCAICHRPEIWKRNGVTVALSVDHDHVTKKVRQLLCYQCNTALGKLKEDEIIIQSMLDYVRRHK